jgi:hypothetical protein
VENIFGRYIQQRGVERARGLFRQGGFTSQKKVIKGSARGDNEEERGREKGGPGKQSRAAYAVCAT